MPSVAGGGERGRGVSNVENGGSFTKLTFPSYSSKLTSFEVWWHSPETRKTFSGAKDKPWAMIWSQGQQLDCYRNGHLNSVGSQVSLDLAKGKFGHNNPVCDVIWTFYSIPLSFIENLPSQFFTSPFLWVVISQVLLLTGGGCYFSSVYLIDSSRNMYYFLQNFLNKYHFQARSYWL